MEGHEAIDTLYGLTPKTAEVFDTISQLDCIRNLYLTGGTGQSLQLNHRLSEDLDFELLGLKLTRPQLDFQGIISEVRSKFHDARLEILGDDHFQMFINKGSVKLSFFRPEHPVKSLHTGFSYNNIKTPNLQELLGMKVFTICVRNKFRDYYDIYCLLKGGCSLKDAIDYAGYLSRHTIKSKTMLTFLLSPNLYPKDVDFPKMNPKYDISAENIRDYIKSVIVNENIGKSIFNPGK